MGANEIYDWLGKLKLRRRDQDVVAGAVTLGLALAEKLGGEVTPPPSELHELLEGQPLEVLAFAVLRSDDPETTEQRVRAYVERVRGVALEITGEDLKREGVPESPALGRALKETLALKLDGFVSGRDEELRAALRLLGR
jgi:hypothetical protein